MFGDERTEGVKGQEALAVKVQDVDGRKGVVAGGSDTVSDRREGQILTAKN